MNRSEEWRAKLTFIFPIGKSLGLPQYLEFQKFQCQMLLLKEKHSEHLLRMQNCPWKGGSQPKSSQTLLTGSAYPTTYKADLGHVAEGTAACSYANSGSGNLEWGRGRTSDMEMRNACLVRRDYKRKGVRGPGMPGDNIWHVSQVMKEAIRSSRHKYAPSLRRWTVISNWDKKHIKCCSHGPLGWGRKLRRG